MVYLIRLLVFAAIFSVFCVQSACCVCFDYKTCETCPNHKTWWGSPCRWCFLDGTCRSPISIYNPCSKTENIVSTAECSNQKFYTYDESLAIKLSNISGIIYIDNPETCLGKLGVKVEEKVRKRCDAAGHTCFAITALSHTDKAVIIGFRGTKGSTQLIQEILHTVLKADLSYAAGGKLEHYFYTAFQSLWPEIKTSVVELLRAYPKYDLWITGHSLGGALASIASTEIVYRGIAPTSKVKLITFGMPRVGDYQYSLTHDRYVKYSFRVVKNRDPVPHTPPCFYVGACMSFPGSSYHHGKEVWYPQNQMDANGGSKYKVCFGIPYNEDNKCSNSLILNYNPNDHKGYFGFQDSWVAKGCPGV